MKNVVNPKQSQTPNPRPENTMTVWWTISNSYFKSGVEVLIKGTGVIAAGVDLPPKIQHKIGQNAMQ